MKNLKKIFSKNKETESKDSGVESKHLSHEHTNQDKGYQCPMKCEGDKVYTEPGNCPVCNMKLVPLNKIKEYGHH